MCLLSVVTTGSIAVYHLLPFPPVVQAVASDWYWHQFLGRQTHVITIPGAGRWPPGSSVLGACSCPGPLSRNKALYVSILST